MVTLMTKGTLGIIICPMVDDNLVYSLRKDKEPRKIYVVENENNSSIKRKFSKAGIEYELVPWAAIKSGVIQPDSSVFNIIIHPISLGLHAVPEDLKETVEELAYDMQPYVDAIGFYLGTCGNYDWNIPAWCEEKGLKPSAMFTDENGNLCHDCVGINIAGGPRYNELQKKFTGHLYVFPAMASNFDEFMAADSADTAATEESLTDEMREVLGIEPGRDGYLRWLLGLGGYEYIFKIDTGLEDEEEFEKDLQNVAAKTKLKIRVDPDGWASLQPTEDIYAKCKSFLQN